MDDVDEEPCSLPCSAVEAKAGLRTIVQLYLVDEGLAKNPLPREDFYRQYSVTPELSPSAQQRLPPPPIDSPRTDLQNSKEFAARVAQGLKQYHAGRLLLRKEEAERREDLEENQDHWDSKAEEWQEVGTDLFEELRMRKRMELKGEAEEGYAQAMLLSPEQSPPPALLNRGLPEATQQLKLSTTKTAASPKNSRRSSQSHTQPSQLPLQSTPKHSRDRLPSLRKGQKCTHNEAEDQEQESLEHTSRTKRQRRGVATAQQNQEPVSATKITQGSGRTKPQARRNRVQGKTKPKTKPIGKNQSESHKTDPLLQQSNPDYSSDHNNKVIKRRQPSHAALRGRENEKRGLEKTPPRTRQLRDTAHSSPTPKADPVTKLGEGPGKNNWRVTKSSSIGARKPKKLQTPRVLPWVLRPRDAVSYCQVGTRAA